VIALEHVSFSYGNLPVLNGVSLRFEPGKFYGIFGANGSGKSTLLKLITGELQPASGTVTPRYADASQRAKEIAFMVQEVPVRIPLTVKETVLLGSYPWGKAANPTQVQNLLSSLGIAALANRAYSQLSGGEKQKVMLARTLLQNTPCILLDEPASFLDPGSRERFFRDLKESAAGKKLLIMVTHDLLLAPRFIDCAVLLHEGKVLASGDPAQVLSQENCRQTYGLTR